MIIRSYLELSRNKNTFLFLQDIKFKPILIYNNTYQVWNNIFVSSTDGIFPIYGMVYQNLVIHITSVYACYF